MRYSYTSDNTNTYIHNNNYVGCKFFSHYIYVHICKFIMYIVLCTQVQRFHKEHKDSITDS